MKNFYSMILFFALGASSSSAHSLLSLGEMGASFDEVVEGVQTKSTRANEWYKVNVSENQDYTRKDRHLDGVGLNGSTVGNQNYDIPTPRKVYTKALQCVFTAKPGETLTPVFMYTGNWMNGFVYLDLNQNGAFEAVLKADKTIPDGSEIVAFSNYEGVNSKGESTGNMNVLNPPSFTLPSDLPYGIYRMRYKVDWSSVDPAGRPEDGNGMLKNGGALCDVLLNVHGDKSCVSAKAEHGEILLENGQPLSKAELPFGRGFTIKVNANKGYLCEGVRIRYGYHLDGELMLNGNPQYQEIVIPAFLLKDNELEIPSEYVDCNVEIEALFVENQGGDEGKVGDYVLNFDKKLIRSDVERSLERVIFNATKGGNTSISVNNKDNTVYGDYRSRQISVVPGDDVNVSLNFRGTGLHCYFYVDFSQDGKFSSIVKSNGTLSPSSELVSYTYYHGFNSKGEAIGDAGSVKMDAMPSFQIPNMLPNGVYRARLKIDYDNVDPAGQWKVGAENQIDDQGGYVVDFLLNVHEVKHELVIHSTNGNVYGANNTALPMQLDVFTSLNVVPTPVGAGYEAMNMKIKHGHHFDGPQYIHGNQQWSEYEVPARSYTIPRDSVDGDLQVSVHYVAQENAIYNLVFSDEFDGENGAEPVSGKWSRCQRQGATWNRWLSDSKEVVYLKDGNLVTRAIPNPDPKTDPVPMITGGIKSQKKFGFTYGKVECRAKVESWVGTFPAIWLMPEDQSAGWPGCGEIDIFEAIDAQQTAYGTIHSHWTYDLGHKNDPKSAFNTACEMDRYHTYGLEWDERNVRWFLDGKLMGTYTKSTNSNALAQGQWPFDKHFYLILNQSVGNGSWARPADVNHTYEFFIDWVRVYQKNGMNNTDGVVGLEKQDIKAALDVKVVPSGLSFSSDIPISVTIYDLQGRKLYSNLLQGEEQIHLARGIYMVNGQKFLVR